MSRAGLEPATTGLKGHCSTIELPTHLINSGFCEAKAEFIDVPLNFEEICTGPIYIKIPRNCQATNSDKLTSSLKEHYFPIDPPYNFALLVYGASSGKLINSLTPH